MARFRGRLHTWNEQRGFGFIRPSEGGDDIFVHVSALPSLRPGPEEDLTFEVALGREGKKKAVNVRRLADEEAALRADRERSAPRRHRQDRRYRHRKGRAGSWVFGFAVLGAAAWFGYGAYSDHFAREGASRRDTVLFACDGRTMCSQMHSCKEAKFFLKNCPGTQIDGDGDGVPCEQQWCTGFFD